MPLVAAKGIHKSFGDLEVLKGVDLEVDEGEVVAIIGRSGSGKSTLLRILNGLESFDGGLMSIDGERDTRLEKDLRPLRLKVGMVFQQFNLFPHLTAGQNVMLAPQQVKKIPKAEVRALAEEMLSRVGLCKKIRCLP
jgi:polar amino acid transport system ATP-binding protein